MATIHFHEAMHATPEQSAAALTDVRPDRSELFADSDDGSGHTDTLTRQPDGTTDVDVVIRREGKNVRGRLLAAFLGTVGQGRMMRTSDDTVAAIDTRSEGALAGQTC